MGCDCINSRSIPIPTKPISLISFLCCVPYFLKSLFSLSPFQIQVEWMDDLRFYALFNSISVIPGRWRMIMKGCVQWNPVYGHMLKQCFIAKEYTFGESSCTISFFFFFFASVILKKSFVLDEPIPSIKVDGYTFRGSNSVISIFASLLKRGFLL